MNKDQKTIASFLLLVLTAALILYLSIHAANQQDRLRTQSARIEIQEQRIERLENTIAGIRAEHKDQAERITYLEDEYGAEGEWQIHRDVAWHHLVNFINNTSERVRRLEMKEQQAE